MNMLITDGVGFSWLATGVQKNFSKVTFNNIWLDKKQLKHSSELMNKYSYGQHLFILVEGTVNI
jgi:hypothetical protein